MWFNQRYLAKNLKPEMRLSIRGERRSTIDAEIVAKSHELVDDRADTLHTRGLVPVYPASEVVSSRRLRTLVDEQLHHAGDRPDALPAEVRAARKLPLRRDALAACHRPRTVVEHALGRRRLAYDELLLAAARSGAPPAGGRGRVKAPALVAGRRPDRPLHRRPAVRAHRRAAAGERCHRRRSGPHRPCAGCCRATSGSGKTAVAVYALLRAVDAGRQGR